MNYIEAVKILMTDARAVAITFKSKADNTDRRIILTNDGQLRLIGKPTGLLYKIYGATIPEFITREDFSIEYKVEKKQRTFEDGHFIGYSEGRIKGRSEGLNEAGLVARKAEIAFAEFKKSMERLFGEDKHGN